jgi:hypothetical protein
MSEPNCYRFVADPAITAYQLAQILAADTFWVSPAAYNELPPDVQAYFVPVDDPSAIME